MLNDDRGDTRDSLQALVLGRDPLRRPIVECPALVRQGFRGPPAGRVRLWAERRIARAGPAKGYVSRSGRV